MDTNVTSYPNEPELRDRENAFLEHSKWWHGMQLQFNHVRSAKPARELILPHTIDYYDTIIREYPVYSDIDDDDDMSIVDDCNSNSVSTTTTTLSKKHRLFFTSFRQKNLDIRELYYLSCFLQHEQLSNTVLEYMATVTLPEIMNQSRDANKNFVTMCRYLDIPFDTSEKDFSGIVNELDGILDKNEFNFQKIQQHLCTSIPST